MRKKIGLKGFIFSFLIFLVAVGSFSCSDMKIEYITFKFIYIVNTKIDVTGQGEEDALGYYTPLTIYVPVGKTLKADNLLGEDYFTKYINEVRGKNVKDVYSGTTGASYKCDTDLNFFVCTESAWSMHKDQALRPLLIFNDYNDKSERAEKIDELLEIFEVSATDNDDSFIVEGAMSTNGYQSMRITQSILEGDPGTGVSKDYFDFYNTSSADRIYRFDPNNTYYLLALYKKI